MKQKKTFLGKESKPVALARPDPLSLDLLSIF